MVKAPTPKEEDRRRIAERKTLVGERVEHVNRIKGLLFAQGVSDYEPLKRNRRARLEELKTGDGRPLPAHLKAQISRELDRLEVSRRHNLRRSRRNGMPYGSRCTCQCLAMLAQLKGMGPEFTAILWSGEAGRSDLSNRRQLAAYALGAAATPWQSGSVAHVGGLQAGNPPATTMIQLAWLWLRHQPTSALSVWFQERVQSNGEKMRKTTPTNRLRWLASSSSRCGNIQPAASSSRP